MFDFLFKRATVKVSGRDRQHSAFSRALESFNEQGVRARFNLNVDLVPGSPVAVTKADGTVVKYVVEACKPDGKIWLVTVLRLRTHRIAQA